MQSFIHLANQFMESHIETLIAVTLDLFCSRSKSLQFSAVAKCLGTSEVSVRRHGGGDHDNLLEQAQVVFRIPGSQIS